MTLLAVSWPASREPVRLVQFAIQPPEGGFFTGTPAVSPTGDRIAFSATVEGLSRIWVRSLDQAAAETVEGTEGGHRPFWSPDGEWLGYSPATPCFACVRAARRGSASPICRGRPPGSAR